MRTLLTVCLLLAASIGYAQEQKLETNSLQAALEELKSKTLAAEAEVRKLRNQLGDKHPKLILAESQLAKIAEAKAKLAAQYALTKLKESNGFLQEHVKVLSEQSAKIKKLMSDEIGKTLQAEYKKLYSNIESVISNLQMEIDKGTAKAQTEFVDALKQVDPKRSYEKYNETLAKSINIALNDEQNVLEMEKRRIEQLRQKMAEREDSLKAQQHALEVQKKALLDHQQAIAKNPSILNSAMPRLPKMDAEIEAVMKSKALAEQAKAQMDALLIAAKQAKEIADKQKKFVAESAIKDSIKKADKQSKEGVEKALKKFDAIQKNLDQKTASVDKRLKGVETELAEVKSLLKKLLEKSK